MIGYHGTTELNYTRMYMMKKRKNEIKFFQFDVEKELDVYKKICNYDKKSEYILYTEWKNHIVTFLRDFKKNDLCDFRHFLLNEEREVEGKLRNLETLWIPINVLYVTIFMTLGNLAVEYIDKCTDILKTVVEAHYQEKIDILVDNYNRGTIIMFILFVLVIIVEIGMYHVGKKEKKKCLSEFHFYDDIITIIDEECKRI